MESQVKERKYFFEYYHHKSGCVSFVLRVSNLGEEEVYQTDIESFFNDIMSGKIIKIDLDKGVYIVHLVTRIQYDAIRLKDRRGVKLLSQYAGDIPLDNGWSKEFYERHGKKIVY